MLQLTAYYLSIGGDIKDLYDGLMSYNSILDKLFSHLFLSRVYEIIYDKNLTPAEMISNLTKNNVVNEEILNEKIKELRELKELENELVDKKYEFEEIFNKTYDNLYDLQKINHININEDRIEEKINNKFKRTNIKINIKYKKPINRRNIKIDKRRKINNFKIVLKPTITINNLIITQKRRGRPRKS